MRGVLVALLMTIASPVLAQEWGHYVNVRFGYAIDVPPGFVGKGEAANSDGQVFSMPTAELRAFGSYVIEGDFEDEVASRMKSTQEDGWNITYQATTPSWASYSAIKGARVQYQRLIPLCGEAVAVFILTYGEADLQTFNPIVDRLVRSLKPTVGSVACPSAG